MKTAGFIFAMIVLAALGQCTHSLDKAEDPILGYYELRGNDNSGTLAFTGYIQIESLEGNNLNGHCKIVRERSASQNLFDQDSPCVAVLKGKKINFDLAPNLDDGGLLFEGELEKGKITGVWLFDGFVGSPPQGPFLAAKRPS
jgi:hypothetical protein